MPSTFYAEVYNTAPGTRGWSVFHSQRINRGPVSEEGIEGRAESIKLLTQSFASFRAQVYRSVGLASCWSLQRPNKAGTRFPPELRVSCDSFFRNLVAATWLKAAVRRNVQAGGFNHGCA